MWDNKVYYKALFFASEAHGGQVMKHKPVPYMAHFSSVAALACKYASMCENIDWDLLVTVALLHDTLEDTSVTYQNLLAEFGKPVADGVLALTKNKELSSDIQIADSVSRILFQPKEIAMVKMCDRLFNVRDRVPSWTEEKCQQYKEDGQLICDILGHVCPQLKCDLQLALDNYIANKDLMNY